MFTHQKVARIGFGILEPNVKDLFFVCYNKSLTHTSRFQTLWTNQETCRSRVGRGDTVGESRESVRVRTGCGYEEWNTPWICYNQTWSKIELGFNVEWFRLVIRYDGRFYCRNLGEVRFSIKVCGSKTRLKGQKSHLYHKILSLAHLRRGRGVIF